MNIIKNILSMRPILSALLRNKTGPILVCLQVAISLAILVNAIYIVSLRLDVSARPSGIAQEENVFALSVSNQKLGDHADQIAMQKREEAAISAVPGVLEVTRINSAPMSRSGSTTGINIDRNQKVSSANVAVYMTSNSLVKTWGLKVIFGRDFVSDDYLELDGKISIEQPKVVMISQSLAKKLYPTESNVIGKEIYWGSGASANALRISGVVDRLQSSGAQANEKGEFSMIVPVRLSNDPYFNYSILTEHGQRDRVIKDVEDSVKKTSATPLSINVVTTQEHRINRYRTEKGLAWMLITVSVLLVVITASGIVGMSSLWVNQRRKQIGIRRALGAQRFDILFYFIAENWLITSAGLILGTALALGLNQLLMSHFELTKLPVHYLFLAPLIFWLLGLCAVFVPAWRAASISPATATRGV